MTTFVKCPECNEWLELVNVLIEIYLPDDTAVTKICAVKVLSDCVDRDSSITEQVVIWCSDNGYAYDKCAWDYKEGV